ncbi:MAG TPA: phosphatase PAP2 family protein [Chitinophagaceae bacterium]|nr:phosphatase PAP2 family protein [Chitinophagaceae bacterium]
MNRSFLLLLSLSFFSIKGTAQTVQSAGQNNYDSLVSTEETAENDNSVYRFKPAVDIPVTLIGTGWSGFALTKIYSKDPSSVAKINSLRVSDINSFDRWAADIHSNKAADASDILFYGSMPLPIVLMLDKKIRKDAGKIGLLYLQAMGVNGFFYTGATYFTNRYRPYAYNPNVPMGDRTEGGAKNSFFAGHVALVGTSTFFVAKVFSDYHPELKAKWIPFALASAATAATGYLRHRGGRHFPSDIILGTTVGTLSGIMVPHLHKNKLFKDENLSLLPFTGSSHGLSLVYRIDRKKEKINLSSVQKPEGL